MEPTNLEEIKMEQIEILHPGYIGPNSLLVLPASDGANRDRAYLSTVQTAAAIVANNRFDGWLTVAREGDISVQPDDAGLIPAGVYFFHVPADPSDDEEPYPIVPNFRSWSFPHKQLPTLWDRVGQRNVANGPPQPQTEPCRITGKTLAGEQAHIVPSSESKWFQSNSMGQYGTWTVTMGQRVIDAPANLMSLRRDAHFLWDQMKFSLVPRTDETQTVAWYMQIMAWHAELYSDWHSRKLYALSGRAPEYLFARFAWDLFPRVIVFLSVGHPRRLAVRDNDGTVDIKTFGAADCLSYTWNQGRGRSASPTKRQRAELESGPQEEDVGRMGWNATDSTGWKPAESTSFDSGVDDMESPQDDADGYLSLKRPRRSSSPEVTPWMRHLIYRDEHNRGRPRRRLDDAM